MGKANRWPAFVGLLVVVAVLVGAFYTVGQRAGLAGWAVVIGSFIVVTGVLHYLGFPLYQYGELAMWGVVDEVRYRESQAALERLRRRERGEKTDAPLTPLQRRRAALVGFTLCAGMVLGVVGALAMFGVVALSAGPFALFIAPIVAIPLSELISGILAANNRAATARTGVTAVHRHAQEQAQHSKNRWGGQFSDASRHDPAVEGHLRSGDLATARAVALEKLQLVREAGDDEREVMYRRYLAKLDEIDVNPT